MSEPNPSPPPQKTELRRDEMFRDRWSAYGTDPRILEFSERLTPSQLKEIDLFRAYDDDTLKRLSADVAVVRWEQGSRLFEEGTYIDLAFFVIDGEVEIGTSVAERSAAAEPLFDATRTVGVPIGPPPAPAAGTRLLDVAPRGRSGPLKGALYLTALDFDLAPGQRSVGLGPGEIFGEIGAMSGWPQSVTARTLTRCRLVQLRLPALRLMRQKSKDFKGRLDAVYRERALASALSRTPFLRGCPDETIETLRRTVELASFEPGDVIAEEGAEVDAFYIVRSGFVRLSQRAGDADIAASYLSKGMCLGDVELITVDSGSWLATATSVEYTELVRIVRREFEALVASQPDVKKLLWGSGVARAAEYNFSRKSAGYPELIDSALSRGFVQANGLLAIDLDRCTRCDDCVRACAATHDGRPRFVREGTRFENLLIAKSCFQCKDPVCLVGCPTGAIHRAGNAAVVEIDDPICIGCKSCAKNCPYDAIVMFDTGEKFPDDFVPESKRGLPRLLASKCDLCEGNGHEPACVTNCPQACAFRIGSVDELQSLLWRKR